MSGATDWGMELHGDVAEGRLKAFGALAMHLKNGDQVSATAALPVCPKCGRASWRPCLTRDAGPRGDRYMARVHRTCVLRMSGRLNVPDNVEVVTMLGGIHPEVACAECESAVMNLVRYVLHVAACETGDRIRRE